MMTLQDYINIKKKDILQEIQKQCQDLALYDMPNAPKIAELLYEYSSRGKLLRGVFVCLGAESFGDEENTHILKVAAALELAQSALLIHDDIMDGDDFRRNKPSLHKLFEKDFSGEKATKTGESLAICTGDIAIFHLFGYLSESPALVKLFSQLLSKTALGQAYEISYAHHNEEISKEDILLIIKNKTTNYTFTLPFMAGAILSGLDSTRELDYLKEFCQYAGYIFQIKDDELNFLEEGSIGKSAGGDIRENKKTLCRYELLQKCPEAIKYFGKDGSIEEVRTLYKDSGVKEHIADLIREYSLEAEKRINLLIIKESHKNLWLELISYLNIRVY